MFEYNKIEPLDDFGTELESVGESALQHAMIIDQFPGGNIEWFDIELPIDGSRNIQSSIRADLVGQMGNNMVLCELKFYTQDSFEEASGEAWRNFVSAVKNAERLNKNNIHRRNGHSFDWRTFKDYGIPMLAADHSTIEKWDVDVKAYNARYKLQILDLGVIPHDYFEMQKGRKTKYTPHIRKSDIKPL